MTSRVNLTTRQAQILRATVQHYIATAEPVGSKAIAQGYDFSVSSATIRHAMGALEKEGLLYQPHVSAGRVPSDSGYRIYVDRLITPCDLQSHRVGQQLNQRLGGPELGADRGMETLLRSAAQILATVSGYIALVTLPHPQPGTRLKHVQLLQVEAGRAMLIVVTDAYQTHSGVFDIPDWPELAASPEGEAQVQQELEMLSNFLNYHLRSRPFKDLNHLNWQELGQEFQRYSHQICSFLIALGQSYEVPQLTQILMSGVSEILHQPEFSELNQFQTIIHLLEEEQELLWPLIFEANESTDQRVSVRIGAENPLEPMQVCTLVSALYHRNAEPLGSVSLLGPTRMAYESAIASVTATADYLSELLSQTRLA